MPLLSLLLNITVNNVANFLDRIYLVFLSMKFPKHIPGIGSTYRYLEKDQFYEK